MKEQRKPATSHRSERFDNASRLRESDFADDIQGRNKLHGDDPRNIRNQRRTMPRTGGATGRPTSKDSST